MQLTQVFACRTSSFVVQLVLVVFDLNTAPGLFSSSGSTLCGSTIAIIAIATFAIVTTPNAVLSKFADSAALVAVGDAVRSAERTEDTWSVDEDERLLFDI